MCTVHTVHCPSRPRSACDQRFEAAVDDDERRRFGDRYVTMPDAYSRPLSSFTDIRPRVPVSSTPVLAYCSLDFST